MSVPFEIPDWLVDNTSPAQVPPDTIDVDRASAKSGREEIEATWGKRIRSSATSTITAPTSERLMQSAMPAKLMNFFSERFGRTFRGRFGPAARTTACTAISFGIDHPPSPTPSADRQRIVDRPAMCCRRPIRRRTHRLAEADPPRGVDRQGRPEPAPNRSSSEGLRGAAPGVRAPGVLIDALHSGQGVLSKIVEIETRRNAANTAPASAEIAALQELQALCADAIAAGGLDEARTLDLTVAVHKVLKGSEWNVRFYRGQATGL